MSAFDFTGFVTELKTLPIEDTEEAHAVVCDLRKQLRDYIRGLDAASEQELDKAIDFVEEIARSSPYKDINIPGAELHHEQTPAQDVSLVAVRELVGLAEKFPQKSKNIFWRLEKIVQNSLDYDIRQEAMGMMWVQASGHETLLPLALEVLERQVSQNSNVYIRDKARDDLSSLATREKEEAGARAFEEAAKRPTDAVTRVIDECFDNIKKSLGNNGPA